jgi:transposase
MKIYEVMNTLSPEQREDRRARLSDMMRNGHDDLAKEFSTYMNDPGLKTTDAVEYKAKKMLRRNQRSLPSTPSPDRDRTDTLGRKLAHDRYYNVPKKSLATTASDAIRNIKTGTVSNAAHKALSGVAKASTGLGMELLKKSRDMMSRKGNIDENP